MRPPARVFAACLAWVVACSGGKKSVDGALPAGGKEDAPIPPIVEELDSSIPDQLGVDLVASPAGEAEITRGPYLQQGTPRSAIIHFQTRSAVAARLRYGAGALTTLVDEQSPTTDHVIRLTGLAAATTYRYAIGTREQHFAGGGQTHVFITPPTPGAAVPTRIWVLGDSGTANDSARSVRDAYIQFAGTRLTDVWLMLGDNAYNAGTNDEYQAGVFDMYPMFLRNTFLWPTIGNHETDQQEMVNEGDVPYFNIFDLPTRGEAGGLATGTERYYAFDHANVHFVCLDSMTSGRSPTGPMLTWLKSDLAANDKLWTIAYWHHPPYSKGSHDSDAEEPLIRMRENALPILEDAGVDLVLTGHSHSYERTFFLNGHYGSSDTLQPGMIKDGSSGRAAEKGPYQKIAAPHAGAVYVVGGMSGQITEIGPLNHPAMFVSILQLGSLVIDVADRRLDVTFLRETGAVDDSFAIVKQ